MRTILILQGLWFFPLLVSAQAAESNRFLTNRYRAHALEQAVGQLQATNTVEAGSRVDYRARQSVLLLAGFEARSGSVFTAYTGVISLSTELTDTPYPVTIDAYPNPFEQVTTIRYVLTKPGRTSLFIQDMDGRLIQQLVADQYQEAGVHNADWKAVPLAAGTYLCVLDTGHQRLSRRIIRR
ncbi:T9SS type A sorting domain-containing protein [Spirosoma koreense]